MKSNYHKWNRDPLTAKTRVCRKCKEEKHISEFHFQDKYAEPVFCLNKRCDCNTCHNKQNRKILLRNTTPEQRRTYSQLYYHANQKIFITYRILKHMANKQKKSVSQRIKDVLESGKSLTNNYVVSKFGGSRDTLRKRVYELRNDGYNIVRTEKNGVSAYKLSASN